MHEVLSIGPDHVSKIYGELSLDWGERQKLYVYNWARKASRVIVEAPFRYGPAIKWHGSRYVEVIIGTGSPGNYSVFYDIHNDAVSGELWFVVAFDKERGVAVLGQDRIVVMDVFANKEIMEIKIDDLPLTAVTFLVVECKFDRNGNISLSYTNTSGEEKTQVIKSGDINKNQ